MYTREVETGRVPGLAGRPPAQLMALTLERQREDNLAEEAAQPVKHLAGICEAQGMSPGKE